jgi:hypothetical protein
MAEESGAIFLRNAGTIYQITHHIMQYSSFYANGCGNLQSHILMSDYQLLWSNQNIFRRRHVTFDLHENVPLSSLCYF